MSSKPFLPAPRCIVGASRQAAGRVRHNSGVEVIGKALSRLRKRSVIATIVVVFQVLGLLSAVHAVMSVRTPQGSIAWGVSLITFPYVAVPAYWIFGRNKFHGYVLARNAEIKAIDSVIRNARDHVDPIVGMDRRAAGVLTGIERLARIPLSDNNSVELLVDGDDTFKSIFDGIDAAADYVLVQFYIVRDDELGRALKAHLVSAAERGVRVFFLYDEVGSIGLPGGYTKQLTDAGVQIRPFHSRQGSGNRFQLNFRNHRKTVVTDGHTAWVGGHNVGDEYMSRDASVGRWRDTHIRLAGPAVIGAQLAFVEDWRWASGDVPTNLSWDAEPVLGGSAQALIIASGPADPVETASLMYMSAINGAAKRIWIASPYFVPDDAIVQSLQLAALRGVDVRVLIPEVGDSRLVKLAAYSYFSELKAVGVRFYRYQDGFLHEKAMLIDDNVATVGTANFDNRSFRLNFEITAVVMSSDFANEVEAMFENDFEASRLMEPTEYDEKSFWFKLAVRTARLTAPVL